MNKIYFFAALLISAVAKADCPSLAEVKETIDKVDLSALPSTIKIGDKRNFTFEVDPKEKTLKDFQEYLKKPHDAFVDQTGDSCTYKIKPLFDESGNLLVSCPESISMKGAVDAFKGASGFYSRINLNGWTWKIWKYGHNVDGEAKCKETSLEHDKSIDCKCTKNKDEIVVLKKDLLAKMNTRNLFLF